MQPIESVWSHFAPQRFQKQAALVFLAFLVVYSILRGLAAAAHRPFWFDELLTLSIASQPNLCQMWAAISRGFDAQAPLFYLVEHVSLALPLRQEIALRLPSILSFPLLLICVFAFVQKQAGYLIASVCTFVLLSTSLFHMYAIEARGYLLMSVSIAFALVCYQGLPSPRWVAMLGVSLFLAQSFHYYAVFAMVPFALAEAVFLLKTHCVRWSVWTALVFGALPLLLFWPVLSAIKTFIGPQVYSRLTLSHWPEYYGTYFLTRSAFAVALATVAGASIVWSLLGMNQASHNETSRTGTDWAEGALLLGLIALPPVLFVLMRITHGVLLARYAMPTTIGVVLGLAFALRIVGSRGIVLFALFVVTSLTAIEAQFWHNKANEPVVHDFSITSMEQFGQIETLIQSGAHPDLPVVYAHVMAYTQVAHYSPTGFTKRLVCLVSRQRALQYENADSMFLTVKALSDFNPLGLADYDEFTASHSEFLLYADYWEWPVRAITADAASMELLRSDGDMRLYLVKMHKPSTE